MASESTRNGQRGRNPRIHLRNEAGIGLVPGCEPSGVREPHICFGQTSTSSGSSTLDLVVADARDQPLDNGEAFKRLEALQHGLERHKDVGSVLSIALLMAEAKRPWYSFLFSWETKFEHLESPKQGRVGRTFVSEDRHRGRFILRMREAPRSRPRAEVVNEIKAVVRQEGFKPVMIAGLYPLQGELSKLVEGSIVRGLGGLLAVFSVIVLIVSRSFRTALAMGVCLAITPFALFGLVGSLGMPLDIISAPAANVALPMGIDEMIHMGYTVRHHRRHGHHRPSRAGGAAWNRRIFSPRAENAEGVKFWVRRVNSHFLYYKKMGIHPSDPEFHAHALDAFVALS